MKKLSLAFLKDNRADIRISTAGGSYSLGIIALVLAILIAVNVFFSVLPASATHFDISAAKLYSVSSSTKVMANSLQKDVTVYWVVQADEEDEIIENLLYRYAGLSEHISVVKKNPDVYPTFAAQYTDETVANNSLIVECGEKYRYISYDSIYPSEIDYSTYSRAYSFDGEGAITSAIDYVVSDDLPKLYVLSGHGEAELSESFKNQVARENIELTGFSLLNEDNIPEDASAILINSPASDISDEEKSLLADYVKNGGKLLAFVGLTEGGSLEKLYSLIEDYGVKYTNGIVLDTDRDHYAFQSPYILLPEIQSGEMTDALISEGYYIIVPVAQGLTVGTVSGADVASLLDTSDSAISKAAGFAMTTYDREDGDSDGPFSLAVDIETDKGGSIVWVASGNMLDDTYNSYSSGANLNFAMNAISYLVGETDAVSIRAKSLSYNYLTISDAQASVIKTWMIGILPVFFIVLGVSVTAARKRRSNEKV